MNFQDLLSKMKELDEAVAVMAPPSTPEGGAGASDECVGDKGMPPKAGNPGLPSDDELLIGEKGMEECGCDDKEMSGGPQVSIRSLIAALQAIEQGTEPEGHHDHDGEVTVYGMDEVTDGDFQQATTAPGEEVAGVDAVTPTGNDLASKGVEKLKVNGGGNPMQESLVNRLQSMYDEIKESSEKKTMSRAANGNEKYDEAAPAGPSINGMDRNYWSDMTKRNDPMAHSAANQLLSMIAKVDPSVDTSHGITIDIKQKAGKLASDQYSSRNGNIELAKKIRLLFQQATGITLD
jgi:hypothetical protein